MTLMIDVPALIGSSNQHLLSAEWALEPEVRDAAGGCLMLLVVQVAVHPIEVEGEWKRKGSLSEERGHDFN